MTPELYWLTLTAVMTALFWLPYSLNRIIRRGLMTAMGNPDPDDKEPCATGLSPWAQRAYYAHINAIENLVVFATLLLIANATGLTNELLITACKVYFFARLAHYVIYTAGIPVLRTLSFFASWIATLIVGLALLGMI